MRPMRGMRRDYSPPAMGGADACPVTRANGAELALAATLDPLQSSPNDGYRNTRRWHRYRRHRCPRRGLNDDQHRSAAAARQRHRDGGDAAARGGGGILGPL